MLLSVIVPVYNEEATIKEIVRAVQEVPLAGVDKEILIVDDGSEDKSPELIKQLADSSDNIRAFCQSGNKGKGSAVQKGIQESHGDIVLIQDADLEYDPKDYQLLLDPILHGKADVVYGSRFITSKSHRVLYYWHSVGNRLITLLSNMITDLNLTDMEVCYKVFRAEVLKRITLQEKGFGFEPEITAKIARIRPKIRIFEVGISYSGRTYEEGKKIGWQDGIWALWCVVKYRWLSGSSS
ncbi:glycosyltransferase family 2 protein [Fibrobacterota bacterium]